jgi:tetratricopeptide (TPR) repeat protein
MAGSITRKDLIVKAKEAEGAENWEQAAEIYKQVLKEDHLEGEAYDRLMMVYRKLKDYKKELAVIDQGIKAFEAFYDSKVSRSKKVVEISNKLAKSFGLMDKKGNSTYDPEPIGKWKKRRLVVEKKLEPKMKEKRPKPKKNEKGLKLKKK